MRHTSSSQREENRPPNAKSKPEEAQASRGPKRILLATRNTRLLAALTRRLTGLGHRVWNITTVDDGPEVWSPGLYDVVVFSAEEAPAIVKRVCEPAKRVDPRLLLVMLASKPFGNACEVPDAVITESDEAVIAEQVLAVVNGSGLCAA